MRMYPDIQLKGDSLRRHKQLSADYAKQCNLKLQESLEDIGISAFKGRNVKEGTFIDAVKAGKVDAGC